MARHVHPVDHAGFTGAIPGGGTVTGCGQGIALQRMDSVKRFTVSDGGVLCFEGYYPPNTFRR